MRSHRFINSLLCLVIQLVAKESKAKENNAGISRLFVLFIDKRYVSQVIHFEPGLLDPDYITSWFFDFHIYIRSAMSQISF